MLKNTTKSFLRGTTDDIYTLEILEKYIPNFQNDEGKRSSMSTYEMTDGMF